MELKDIVLKKNDIVYYDDDYLVVEGLEGKTADEVEGFVSKIERPVKYETIYEASKEILDKEEKEWLENFLRPFIKARIRVIKSAYFDYVGEYGYEELTIMIEDCEVNLPPFSKDIMYKGMELNKEYTLEELGLFKEE